MRRGNIATSGRALSRRPIAAIDIGSNSIFLMIVRIDRSRPVILHSHKVRARLAAAVDGSGCLSRLAIDGAVATLQQFRKAIDDHDAEVRAVATEAVRGACNGRDFIDRVKAEAGIDVEIISGEREAELVYLGVRHDGRIRANRLLCVDVGGGSTEVVLGSGDQVLLRASAAVGAVAICSAHLGLPPVTAEGLQAARSCISQAIRPLAGRFTQRNWDRAVGTSGTMQRLARIVRASSQGGQCQDIDGLIISASRLDQITTRLAECPDMAARLAIPGMDPQRADILLGGAMIFQELGRALAIRRWTVSRAGLRMGIVADVLRRRGQLDLGPA